MYFLSHCAVVRHVNLRMIKLRTYQQIQTLGSKLQIQNEAVLEYGHDNECLNLVFVLSTEGTNLIQYYEFLFFISKITCRDSQRTMFVGGFTNETFVIVVV